MTDLCSMEKKPLLTVDAALAHIDAALGPMGASEKIPLKNALGRMLAEPVYSAINLPPERTAAMDGYAFLSGDIQAHHSFTLESVGTSWAGRPYTGELKAGQCVRIFTGAVMPEQADSVIMQEQVHAHGNAVEFPAQTQAGRNVRQAGEDIKQGGILCAPPKQITAAELGLFAAAGVAKICVKKRLRIGFFSTGDELVPVGQGLQSGQIYDSNRYLLTGLLNDACFDVTDLGVIADDKHRLKQQFMAAAQGYDVLISTGGASVGEADFIKEVLAECGQVTFWKIAVKPGKPLAFGKIGGCQFFGLPGNPVAVMVTFNEIVMPALRLLCGAPAVKPLQILATLTSPLKKSAGRQEFQRGVLSQQDNGEFFVASAGHQGSHVLSSLSRANCYIVLPLDCDGVKAGDKVRVQPFSVLL